MPRRCAPWIVLAMLVCACTNPEQAVGWPRIEVEQKYRHHGDYGGWTVDEQGHYFTRSKGSADGSSSTYTRCGGMVAPQLVEPWFQQIRQWSATPDATQAHPDDAPDFEGPTLEYFEAEGRPSYAADDAAMQARRALAREIIAAMPETDEASCTKSDRGY